MKYCLLLIALLMSCASATADQTDPALDGLFEQLQQTSSNVRTQELQNQVWQAWLDAPDDNARALMSQISQAMSIRQFDMGLHLCTQLIDSAPDYAEGWNKRATIHYLMGNHSESVADIRETLRREPRHFGALSGLGLIFMASGNMRGALEAFERVLALTPGSDNARRSVERARHELGSEI